MFPLKQKVIGGYKFKQKTSYSSAHLGVDYHANYVDLFSPFSGTIKRMDGPQGGVTLWFYPDNQVCKVMRFMHLSKVLKTGRVNEGDLIAVTGATGSLAGSPHLHLDCSKNDQGTFWEDINNFIDPEGLDWSEMLPNLSTNLLRYDGEPTVYYSFSTEEDFNKFTGSAWDKVKVISKPVKTVPVKEIQEVIKYIDKIEYKDDPKTLEQVAQLRAMVESMKLSQEDTQVLTWYHKIINWIRGAK